MFGETRLMNKLEKFGVRSMPLDPDFTFGEEIDQYCSVINSKREIIASCSKERTIGIYSQQTTTGMSMMS